MKSFSKILLAGAFAMIAIAVSAAPSEAARGKAKAKAKEPAACVALTTCTMAKSGVVHQCWGGKWQAMLLPACSAGCPPPCPK